MKNQINEIKRMQQLAGIINESQLIKNVRESQLNEELKAEDIKVGETYTAQMPTSNDGKERIDVKVKVLGPDKSLSDDHFVVEPLESKRYINPVSKGENEFSKGKHYGIEAKYLSPSTNESFDQLDEIVDKVLAKLRNK